MSVVFNKMKRKRNDRIRGFGAGCIIGSKEIKVQQFKLSRKWIIWKLRKADYSLFSTENFY